EEHQRMLGTREYTNQPPNRHLEADLRGRRRDIRHGRLFSDDELQLWNEAGDERTVWVKSLTNLFPPAVQLDLGLAEDLTNQSLDGLGHRGVRNIALELIEFARCEESSRQN